MAIPTFSEWQELGRQFGADVARMRRCLQSAGREVTVDDVVRAWAVYSNLACARWLTPPEEDDAMLAILLEHLSSTRTAWVVTLLDAGDGSGDAILPLPDDLISQLSWQVGDELVLLQGHPGRIIIRSTKGPA